MAANKTKANALSVSEFIDSISSEAQRADAKALVKLLQNATGESPKMWGTSIIGFGSYHYVYDSGREGDMPVVSFSPRKTATVLYGVTGFDQAEGMLSKLGKHTAGKGCVYVKNLADVDANVLKAMVVKAAAKKQAK